MLPCGNDINSAHENIKQWLRVGV